MTFIDAFDNRTTKAINKQGTNKSIPKQKLPTKKKKKEYILMES